MLTEQYPDHTGGSPGDSTYGIVTFTPDAAGRVLRKQDQKGDTCTYIYDFAGRLEKREYRWAANSPSGAIADTDTFTDDNSGRMLTAHSGRYSNTVIDTRAYDDGGRMTGSTYNNGVLESRAYNNDNTLQYINFGGTGTAIGNMTYSWDANKNKTSESIAGTMSDYGFTIPTNGYDKEDRLVSYNRTQGLDQSWNLSDVGNWNSVTTNSDTQNRTHGLTHKLLTGAGQSVTHDVKGNMTLIPAALRPGGSALSLTWDFDNRMVSADVGNNSTADVTHTYDALGRRVARTETSTSTTTVFVQVGQQTICDYPYGGTPAQSIYHYLYASYIDEPVMRWETAEEEAVYYHRNQQYSVIAVTDDSGAIVERYSYTAYGDPAFFDGSGLLLSPQISLLANRYTYTGREWDSTIRLYHYRARMYDPQLGRFLGRDPIGYRGSKWNLQRYVDNRPLVRVDPHGKVPGSPWHPSGPFAAEFEAGGGGTGKTCKEIFDEWKNNNPVNPAWANQLPACPCNIGCKRCYGRGRIGAPDPVDALCTPEGWERDLGCGDFSGCFVSWWLGISTSTHPGAKGCIRKDGSGKTTQQCCYDRSGDLITGGVGAGTPDWNDPNHYESDVLPWLCAAELDGNPSEIKDGPHMQEYIKRRPPNNANNCKSNVK